MQAKVRRLRKVCMVQGSGFTCTLSSLRELIGGEAEMLGGSCVFYSHTDGREEGENAVERMMKEYSSSDRRQRGTYPVRSSV